MELHYSARKLGKLCAETSSSASELYSKVAAGETQQVGAQAARFNAYGIPDPAE